MTSCKLILRVSESGCAMQLANQIFRTVMFLFFSNCLAVRLTDCPLRGLPSTHGTPIVKAPTMDASPAHDQLGPGALPDAEHRLSTGHQPCWTFTEGVTGPVTRPGPSRKVNRRMCKWSTATTKLVRGQNRQCKQTASYGTALTACSQTSPFDQTRDLLDALPSMTRDSENIIMRYMPLSMSEAAIFVHPELEASRQVIWAQMLSACNVDCVVN